MIAICIRFLCVSKTSVLVGGMNVAVFTSSEMRHLAFSAMASKSRKINVVACFLEEGKKLSSLIQDESSSELQRQHLLARIQCEKDFFELFIESSQDSFQIFQKVQDNWFSSAECLEVLDRLKIDLILVYGASIIKGEILDIYKRRILNMHLGLSPYYRGSGTNYFPFVNGEPEFCGATYMYLDDGVDTGEIIHQIRPLILDGDSFFQLSFRFLVKAFKIYLEIAENLDALETDIHLDIGKLPEREFLVYKRKDFTLDSLRRLYQNLESGMISRYVHQADARCKSAPIIQQKAFIGVFS